MINDLKFCDIIYCKIKNTPHKHPKFYICIDPIQKFFIFINTEENQRNPDGDIPIKPIREFNFLDHDSYINTSHIERIFQIDVEWAHFKKRLPDSSVEKLAKTFLKNKMITPKNRKDFWGHLSKNLQEKLKDYKPKSGSVPNINQLA